MAINNYKHNLNEPLIVKDLDINGRVTSPGIITFTKSIQLNADNTSGGGLILSDDGDFVDLNTGYGAFRFTSGIQVYSGNRSGSAAITLESGGNIIFADSGTTTRGVVGTAGNNDQWFFGGGAIGSNAGFAQISTGDDGTEPIYVRQYVGDPRSGGLARSLTLLDESGNTSFPGNVGIGSTLPTSKLVVSGDGRFTGVITATSFSGSGANLTGLVPNTVSSSSASTPQFIGFLTTSSGTTTSILVNTGLVFIPSSGNLGVGTTNPTSKLDIIGNVKVTGVVTATSVNGTNLNFSGISTLSTVRISSGIITATSGIITYYGDGQYLSNIPTSVAIGTVAPSSPVVGKMWYNSNLGRTFVYYNDGDSSQWVDAAPFNIPQETLLTPARNDTTFTATAGQTVFVVSYRVGYIDVYLNGIRLSGTEFIANNGTYIILAEPAAENDVVSVVEISVGVGDTGASGLPGQSLTIGTRMGAYVQYANVGIGITILLRSGVGTATF